MRKRSKKEGERRAWFFISRGFFSLKAKLQQKCDLKRSARSIVSKRTKRHMEEAEEVSWD